MTRQFTLLQLFNVVDGRITTSIEDVYDVIHHVFDDKHIPTTGLGLMNDSLHRKNPQWLQECKKRINEMGIKKDTPIGVILAKIKVDNPTYNIPQLKDEGL